MSSRETPLTRWYWRQVGGLLIEEFHLVRAKPGVSPRYLDGLIVLGEEKALSESRFSASDVELDVAVRQVRLHSKQIP